MRYDRFQILAFSPPQRVSLGSLRGSSCHHGSKGFPYSAIITEVGWTFSAVHRIGFGLVCLSFV